MRYIDELYQAAAAAVAESQPITTDPRGHAPKVDGYDVPAETVERLRLALEPALRSIELIKRRQNGRSSC